MRVVYGLAALLALLLAIAMATAKGPAARMPRCPADNGFPPDAQMSCCPADDAPPPDAQMSCCPAGNEPSPAVTLYLKNGNFLSGEVLKERADSTVLDTGFTVLEVPADQIARRAPRDAGPAAAPARDGGDGMVPTAPANMPERPVKDLAQELCESVALVSTPGGLGSGFAIDDKGHFVTNAHVIQGEQEVSITLFKRGETTLERIKLDKVKIEAVNPFLDLALLKADSPEGLQFKPVPIAPPGTAQEGQGVFAIGSPLGLERTVSEGIISNSRRDFEGQLYLQTTAPINPGNSGGPLFNLRGQVIGVTNMKAGLLTEGLSFAIPVSTLWFFLNSRDAFAFDKDNPNSGFHYLPPPRRTPAAPGGK